MGLITPNTSPWERKCAHCFEEAAQLIDSNKEVTITDLWSLVSWFQVALREIIKNQKRNPKPSMEEMLDKK